MKKLIASLTLVLAMLFQLSAQNNYCGSKKLNTHKFATDSVFRQSSVQKEALIYQRTLEIQQQRSQLNQRGAVANCDNVIYTIPVVFHIIHNNGSENISDADVMASLANLNLAYRNSGYYDQSVGADVEFEFCLAQRDPNGNATTGINRVVSTLTNMILETQDLDVKDLSRWDPTQYMNIWVVKSICDTSGGCGTAGYAYYAPAHGANYDGILAEASYINSTNSYGVLLAHETGHYLNLYHTFEDGCTNNDCLADGDNVCDTPPDNSTSGGSCSSPQNSCSTDADDTSGNNPFSSDVNDIREDYMDYGNWSCMNQFTEGQKDRARLSFLYYRSSLLNSLGCIPPVNNDVAINAILLPNSHTCSASFIPVIEITNNGTSTLTSLTVDVTIDNGTNYTNTWTGSIAAGATGNVTGTTTITSTGSHIVEVVLSSPNGATEDYVANNTLCTSYQYYDAADTICEEFTGGIFPPNNWSITDGDGGYFTWRDTTVACYGKVAYVPSYNINSFADSIYDNLQVMNLDLSGYSNADLNFDIAYKRSYSNRKGRLRVYVSDDCGITFTEEYSKTGTSLATVSGTETSGPWVPTSCGDWRTETVDLNAYVGSTIQIVFSYYIPEYWAQNIYLTNVCMSGSVCNSSVDLGSNREFCEGGSTTLDAGAGFDSYSWSPGGSSSQTLAVSGLASGIYQYKVTVTACSPNTQTYVDSVTITVKDTAMTFITYAICQGESYLGYNSTGLYTDVYTGSNNCDSTRVLNLYVVPTVRVTVDTTICYGKTYHGYTSSNTYIDTFSVGAVSCDSIRTLNLTVLPQNAVTVTASICSGQTYEGYNSTGIFVDTYTDANGCDSVRTLNLTLESIKRVTIDTTICFADTIAGYFLTDTYIDTFNTGTCDSIRTLNLTVRPANATFNNVSICPGESYAGHTTAGFHLDIYTDRYGCDSASTILLSIKPKYTRTVNQTICYGDNYQGYSSSGTYKDTFAAANTCDSVRTLNLTVRPQNATTVNQTICQGDSYYGYTSSNTYTDVFTDRYSCDSTRTLNLTVTPTVYSTVTTTICYGTNYYGYTSSNTYVDTFAAASTCDSVRTLNLTVRAQNATNVTATICQGESYLGYTSTGTFSNSYTDQYGCDSTRTLYLTVNPTYSTTIDTSICYGETFRGYAATGIYRDTLQSAYSCDSIIVTDLTVMAANVVNINVGICSNQSYYGYTTTGNYTDYFTDQYGCDSTRIVDLVVSAYIQNTVTTTICYGATFEGYSSNGTYRDTFGTASCDSIRILNLTVRAANATTVNKTICQGDSYAGYTATGIYTDTYTDGFGCDSTRTLNLTVNPTYAFTIDTTLCYGETYLSYDSTDTYVDILQTALGCDSIRTLTLTVLPQNTTSFAVSICQGENYEGYTSNGTYTDTYADSEGCDSTRTVILTVGAGAITYTVDSTICAGGSVFGYTTTGIFRDTFAIGACDSVRVLNLTVNTTSNTNFTQTICPGQSYEGYTATGIYTDTLAASAGCDSIRTINLTVTSGIIDTAAYRVCLGDSITIGGVTIGAGTYYDTISLPGGCDSVSVIIVEVRAPAVVATISQVGNTLLVDQGFNGYQWFINNQVIHGATTDTYTADVSGWYFAAVTDGNGCVQLTDSIYVAYTAIDEPDALLPVKVYPNPTSGKVSIEVPQQYATKAYSMALYNTLGQKVYGTTLEHDSQLELNLSAFNQGLYILQINSEVGNAFVRLVIEE